MIRHFEKPVHERTPEEMCDHARSILDVLCEIPVDELNDGDIMCGQLAENIRHRVDHPVDLRLWRS